METLLSMDPSLADSIIFAVGILVATTQDDISLDFEDFDDDEMSAIHGMTIKDLKQRAGRQAIKAAYAARVERASARLMGGYEALTKTCNRQAEYLSKITERKERVKQKEKARRMGMRDEWAGLKFLVQLSKSYVHARKRDLRIAKALSRMADNLAEGEKRHSRSAAA
ncbi:hypothetical protein EWM64_g336 [Hericium alpestre]|uniref:Uncharacterized protein n=1 Tax=Hericium alpestre TaxID=135208 RepID=A0A4Z0ACY8_9AGAM|nr:hypothetical protein EWM64_g336 [Hericium alpestre]